jgi:hypothetical protein
LEPSSIEEAVNRKRKHNGEDHTGKRHNVERMKPYETYSDSESNETMTQHDGSIRHPSMEEQEIKERKWPSSIVNMNMLQDTAMDPDGKRPLMEIHAYSESESDGTTDTKVVEHDGILEIQDRMWEYLQFLSKTSHTDPDQFNSRLGVNFPNVHNKILAAFGQCKDIPIFLFDMTLHSVSDWLALYACAIRCAIQKCDHGFVFLVWEWSECPGNNVAHATLLYLDISMKLQVFFDPSGAVPRDMMEFMAHNHIWEGRHDKPSIEVVDYDRPDQRDVQWFFGPCTARRDRQTVHAPRSPPPTPRGAVAVQPLSSW